MRILAFDTTLAACSAAVWAGGSVRAARTVVLERGHAERLMPLIETVMGEAALTYGDLDAVAVTVGPGSFTGVRIGLATARGLGLAAGRPIIGLTTLEVIADAARQGGAHDAGRGEALFVAVGAGRGWVYLQGFGADGAPIAPPDIMAIAAARTRIGDLTVAGEGAATLVGAGSPRRAGPETADATHVAALAARRFGDGRPLPDRPPAALYLRQPDARPMAVPPP